jgi:hypothetical protein
LLGLLLYLPARRVQAIATADRAQMRRTHAGVAML